MAEIIFLTGGVCCALLCHWMIRHTYTYHLEDTDEKDWMRRPKERKVWSKKIVVSRWKYILIWMVCILLAPVAIIAPIIVGVIIAIACNEGDARFIYTNRLFEWLKEEV